MKTLSPCFITSIKIMMKYSNSTGFKKIDFRKAFISYQIVTIEKTFIFKCKGHQINHAAIHAFFLINRYFQSSRCA